MKKGHGVQIIYGPQVTVIKSKLEDYLEYAKKSGIAQIYYINRSGTNVTVLNVKKNTKDTRELVELMGDK